MKNNKSLFKIIALIIAIGLIGVILSVTNSFVGNPISAAFAKRAAKKHIEKNYSNLDLVIEKPRYNFKFGEYMVNATSKTSIDTHFNIYYRNGEIRYDDYDSYVLGKFNTLDRLQKECANLVQPILSQVQGLENNRAMVLIDKWEYEQKNEAIQLDMAFDQSLPIDMQITLRADFEDSSLKNIAQILEASYHVLMDNGFSFTSYHVFSEHNDVLLMIDNVQPADIESGELEKLLEEALNYEDEDEDVGKGEDKPEAAERIRVFIKDGRTQ